MNPITIRMHPLISLLVALALMGSSLAAAPPPASIPAPARSLMPAAEGPDFPNCAGTDQPPVPTCTNLQVFLLIDDSSSMRYTDPTRQRLEGVKNVLDILAKEYYLPAVEANAKDAHIELPNIQVALIHFSSAVLYNSGWKTVNPQSLDAWAAQLETFNADLEVKIDYTQPQATLFHTAFDAAATLAAEKSQPADCPRLVMLFTDGVPHDGERYLTGAELTRYMNDLQVTVQQTFNRSNDALFVTAFGSDNTFRRFWDRDHKQKWEAFTKDSGELDLRRVVYVPTQELAARMERIIGSTIGSRVYTLTPLAGQPQQYTTEIPKTVESLRMTYYTINPGTSFTVTGPDGKTIQPDGEKVILSGEDTSIQVLQILYPAHGTYQIATTAPGGVLTQLVSFEKITARLSSPMDPLLQFTSGQIGVQLSGADGKPIALSPEISIQAAAGQAGGFDSLELAAGANTFTTSWMPLFTEKATVYACATLKDNQGETIILYDGPVGEINIDPVSVQVGESGEACVPTEKEINIPLQLINSRSQQPAAIDAPVLVTANFVKFPGETPPVNTFGEIEAQSDQYVVHFKPTSPGEVQIHLTADAIVDEANYRFAETITTIQVQPPRQMVLSLESFETLGDRLSKVLYLGLHPRCIDDHTEIVIGRHAYGLFGPTELQISGRFSDADDEPDIERFAVQLVSPDGGTSSETISDWSAPDAGDGLSTLVFPAPGLGLYDVTITDQGENLECTALDSLPTHRVLLINDYWEYLVILILLVILLLLMVYLFRRYRKRNYSHEIPLLLSIIVLISLNVVLVYLVYTQTFKCQLNCAYLIDRSLNSDSLCSQGLEVPFEPLVVVPTFRVGFTFAGITTPEVNLFGLMTIRPITIIPGFTVGPYVFDGIKFTSTVRILPALEEKLNAPLEALRRMMTWIILLLIALASLVLTFSIKRVLSPEGRKAILTNLGIWLFFFVLFCSLFYYRVVASAAP